MAVCDGVAALALAGGLALAVPASAGVIGRDDRLPLAEFARSPQAEDRAIARAARASGLVTCDNGRFGSASLVLRGDLVVTAGHIFHGELPRIRAGRVRCVFVPRGDPGAPRIEVRLDTLRLGAERVTGVNICSNGRDWAVVRLAARVPDAVPYLLDDAATRVGANLVAISHGGGSGRLSGPGGHAGRCQLRANVGPCRQTGVPLLFTDCDSEAGSSGGAVLTGVGEHWTLAAITRGASPAGGPAFDQRTAYHMAVPVRGPLERAIREMAR